MRRILSQVFVVGLLLAVTAVADEPGKLSLDTYLEFEQVAEPQISPDGKQVVYTRRWIDKLNEDRKSTRLNSSHIQKSRMPSSA